MKKHIPAAIFKLILTIFLLNIAYVIPSSANSEIYTSPDLAPSDTHICSANVDKPMKDSEWSQFLSDFNGGKFFSNIGKVFADNDSSRHDMLNTGDTDTCRLGEVLAPDAVWLFASALIGFVGLSNKRRV